MPIPKTTAPQHNTELKQQYASPSGHLVGQLASCRDSAVLQNKKDDSSIAFADQLDNLLSLEGMNLHGLPLPQTKTDTNDTDAAQMQSPQETKQPPHDKEELPESSDEEGLGQMFDKLLGIQSPPVVHPSSTNSDLSLHCIHVMLENVVRLQDLKAQKDPGHCTRQQDLFQKSHIHSKSGLISRREK